MSYVPVIDFGLLNINVQEESVKKEEIEELALKLVDVLSTVGFVYLNNHGVSMKLIDDATEESGKFFQLSPDVKETYRRHGDDNHGWVALERESLNPSRPGDLKETFNVTPCVTNKIWPEKEVPAMKQLSEELIAQLDLLSTRILHVMARGLKLENPEFFSDRHQPSKPNMRTLRYLYYPTAPDNIKAGQIRCGEHSDYGSITLLFQDAIGGLQVMSRDQGWVDARPIPGTVVVNIGDLMQRWTADRLVSTKHRVVIPEEELGRKIVRRSLAYFVHPDNDVMITSIDGSDKYEPITALDYLKMRFSVTY